MIEGVLRGLCAHAPAPREGDYPEGGLIHCGVCRAPRQCRVELMGKERIVACLCRCEAAARDAREAEAQQAKQRARLSRLRTQGLEDRGYRQWTFEADDGRTPQLAHARRYVENWEVFQSRNTGLLLWGGVGTGKTFFAACVANALLARGVPVLMTNFIRLANGLQRGFGEDKNAYIRSLDQYGLLVIDDLGAERESGYMQEQVYSIIDSRYRAALPLIITTNLTLGELKHPKDMACARIYDRVLEMTVPIRFDGPERRREIHADKLRGAAGLLAGDG